MTRIEEIEKASKEYRKSREECGVSDPILLEEVDDAHFMGAMWADEHPIHYDGKAYLYVLHKGVEQGKKEMLENVCEYIKENLYHAWINTNNGNAYRTQSTELFIKNLRKAMEEKQ